MNLNKVYILGRVTANPEVKTTVSGEKVSSFSIATNRTWTDKTGAKKEATEFHNVVFFGRQAEIAGQFLSKGALVLVEGRLQSRTYEKDGIKRKITEILGERIQLGPRGVGGSSKDGLGSETSSEEEFVPNEVPVIDLEDESSEIRPEDLPF